MYSTEIFKEHFKRYSRRLKHKISDVSVKKKKKKKDSFCKIRILYISLALVTRFTMLVVFRILRFGNVKNVETSLFSKGSVREKERELEWKIRKTKCRMSLASE